MTGNMDERCWEYYGFPDPTMITPRLPYMGMIKALAERILPIKDRWEYFSNLDYDTIFSNDNSGWGVYLRDWEVPHFFHKSPDHRWEDTIDYFLRLLCSYYMNPDKLKNIDTMSSNISDLMWTFDDLVLAAADGKEEDVITTEHFFPRWSVKWLLQRCKMIKLLRFAKVPHLIDGLYGGCYYDYHSAAGALEKAKERMNDYKPRRLTATISVGMEDWYYRYLADILCFTQCRVDLPETLSGNGDSYLLADLVNAGSDGDFALSCGKVHPGWNCFKADSRGVFLDFDISEATETVPYPTKPGRRSIGWDTRIYNGSYSVYAFSDYNESFYFKEDEQDPE